MGRKVDLQRAIYFTKLTVILACTWPPSRTASKTETMKYNIAWCLYFLSALCLFFPLLLSISAYQSDSLIITQSMSFVGAVTNLMIKMIVYRIYYKRTQIMIQEMEDSLENAQPREILVYSRYVDRCSRFHFFISILNYLTTATIVCTPFFFRDQALPTYAVYPFSIDSGILMILAYLHQSFAGFQCSSGVTIDCQAALMLWFAGARLEIVADELKYVNNVEELKIWVRKHRKLLAYAVEVSDTMAYIALASSFSCGIAAIMSCIQLCGNQSLFVKVQFAPVAMISSMNLFVCAWPADNLLHVCKKLENEVYSAQWMDMSLEMRKYILLVLQKCQRPITVSVGGFLPTLSLASYSSFLWLIFSYFTTLRLVMTDEE